jgi:aminopeptidase
VDQGERLQRYAELAVRLGANVAEGQDVVVLCHPEHRELARAVGEEAYRAGARYVDVSYNDPHLKLHRLRLAAKESLPFIPPWWDSRNETMVRDKGCLIQIAGDPEPHLLEGIDSERMRLAIMPSTPSLLNAVVSQEVNWTIIAGPLEGWAETIFGEPDIARLWELVAAATRLDDADPVASWEGHIRRLAARADALNAASFDGLRFLGPGTDLFIGLMPQSLWRSASATTSWGRRYVANMPTEEVFTTPDRRRTEGVVRSTRPLDLGGVTVEGLELTFEKGRIVDVRAERNPDAVTAQLDRDEGARMLGEVALVDQTSAVGATGVVFHNTLFDENATCHIAYGRGLDFATKDLPESEEARGEVGFNTSMVHTDAMIGGPKVDVFGVNEAGVDAPLIEDNEWVHEPLGAQTT